MSLDEELDPRPDRTPAAEAFPIRAYPATDIPSDASLAARAGWAALERRRAHSAGNRAAHRPGARRPIPPCLNPFLCDGASTSASGRVTAMAIAPTCSLGKCTLYAAAAGGGVWRTDKALNGSNWQYISGSFGTDTRCVAADGLRARCFRQHGLCRHRRAERLGDSEAGVGIYKTTDGGQDLALVPGSDIFFQRSIGQMAFDNAGNLLVPIASGVRGVSSVSSGAVGRASGRHPLSARLYRQDRSRFSRLVRPLNAARDGREFDHALRSTQRTPESSTCNDFSQGSGARSTTARRGRRSRRRSTPTSAPTAPSSTSPRCPNGNTRMYVGVGNQSDAGANPGPLLSHRRCQRARPVFTRHDDAAEHRLLHRQCWYDNVVYTPPGAPDVVYLGGSFSYGQLHGAIERPRLAACRRTAAATSAT